MEMQIRILGLLEWNDWEIDLVHELLKNIK